MPTSLYVVKGKIHEIRGKERLDPIDQADAERKYGSGGEWILLNETEETRVRSLLASHQAQDCNPDEEFHGVIARS